MSEPLLFLSISVGIIVVTYLCIPYIESCGICKKNIYHFQGNTYGIMDRYHNKCYKNHDFEENNTNEA